MDNPNVSGSVPKVGTWLKGELAWKCNCDDPCDCNLATHGYCADCDTQRPAPSSPKQEETVKEPLSVPDAGEEGERAS